MPLACRTSSWSVFDCFSSFPFLLLSVLKQTVTSGGYRHLLMEWRKFENGSSGRFSEGYHRLLGTSPWIFVKRLLPPRQECPHLSEGDVAAIFSQFGEVVNVLFVRHRRTGRFLGTAFIQFSDFRSCIAAADEMNSDFSTGELCVLYPDLDGALGIVVERCQANEVPQSNSLADYPTWAAHAKKRQCPIW